MSERASATDIGSRPGHLIAEINLDAIVHNCGVLRSLAPPACKLCVAVKADAYGHGLGLVLPAFQQAEVDMLAVAAIAEAGALRELGWCGGILLMGSELAVYPATEQARRAEWLVGEGISISVSQLAEFEPLAAAGKKLAATASLHFMFDSGMRREGGSADDVVTLFEAAAKHSFVSVDGLYTHMAVADEVSDAARAFTRDQLREFQALLESLRSRGFAMPLLHAANSPAAIDTPDLHFDMLRPGVSIYGCHPASGMQNRPDLRQVLRLRSYLSQVKRLPRGAVVGYGGSFRAPEAMYVGIVPVGYADGYDRRLSNCGVMSIAGNALPVIGRVSMDQVTLDLRPLTAAGRTPSPGDEVVVIDDAPDAPNNIEALAALLDTVPHEVMTGIGGRVQRLAVRRS